MTHARFKILFLVVIVGFLAVAAFYASGSPRLGETQEPYEVPFGWQEIDAGGFNVALPPGWTFKELQGIDSSVGKFSNGKIEMFSDYGWYSGDPSQDNPEYKVSVEVVDDYEARLFSSEINKDAGIYFGHVGGPEEFGAIRLSIYSSNLTPEQQDIVWEILRTITFNQSVYE